MKRIGILGGMSHESTIRYYEVILQKYYESFHDFNYPEVVIFSLNFQKVIDYENNYRYTEYIRYLISGIEFLKNAGAQFIIMAANSPHSVFSELQNLIDIPILSIVNVTAKVARSFNLNTLLLLGIKYTMQSSYYQDTFRIFGMNVITPIIEEQEVIDDIIFKELVLGKINENSKNTLLHIIKNYNIDGVILGCTELPLILKQNDLELIMLDTLDIHTSEALKYCLE